jgi:hypothetical protein
VLHFDFFGGADAYRDRLAKRRGHGASDVGCVSLLYLVWRPKKQTTGSVQSQGRGESSQLGQSPSHSLVRGLGSLHSTGVVDTRLMPGH